MERGEGLRAIEPALTGLQPGQHREGLTPAPFLHQCVGGVWPRRFPDHRVAARDQLFEQGTRGRVALRFATATDLEQQWLAPRRVRSHHVRDLQSVERLDAVAAARQRPAAQPFRFGAAHAVWRARVR